MEKDPFYMRVWETFAETFRGVAKKQVDEISTALEERTKGVVQADEVRKAAPWVAATGAGLLGLALFEPITRVVGTVTGALRSGVSWLEKIPVVGLAFMPVGWALDIVGAFSGLIVGGLGVAAAFLGFESSGSRPHDVSLSPQNTPAPTYLPKIDPPAEDPEMKKNRERIEEANKERERSEEKLKEEIEHPTSERQASRQKIDEMRKKLRLEDDNKFDDWYKNTFKEEPKEGKYPRLTESVVNAAIAHVNAKFEVGNAELAAANRAEIDAAKPGIARKVTDSAFRGTETAARATSGASLFFLFAHPLIAGGSFIASSAARFTAFLGRTILGLDRAEAKVEDIKNRQNAEAAEKQKEINDKAAEEVKASMKAAEDARTAAAKPDNGSTGETSGQSQASDEPKTPPKAPPVETTKPAGPPATPEPTASTPVATPITFTGDPIIFGNRVFHRSIDGQWFVEGDAPPKVKGSVQPSNLQPVNDPQLANKL
ncbi:MAG: hypothetical protein JO089_01325, partial [Alphaproteobacteria bacterium]|nr:hypothetical protein [Alphaproteobacteria bacterium]